MDLRQLIDSYYSADVHHFLLSDQQLLLNELNIGFSAAIRDGKVVHNLTRDLVVSINRFSGGHQANIVFDGETPIYLELTDTELPYYYSDYVQLRYVMSGKLYVELEGNEVCFNEGDIYMVNAMALHRESLKKSNCQLLNVNVNKTVFTEVFTDTVGLSSLKEYLHSIILQRSEQQHYLCFSPPDGHLSDMIENCFYNIFTEIVHGQVGFRDISRGHLIRLMDHLANNYEYNFDRADTKLYEQKLFEAVQEYILSHLDSVTMADLTANFHFQPNFFNNLIRKKTGLTYSHYLITARIERAKHLLRSTDLPVEEIMWFVGYNNKGFFYRKFEELTGLCPRAYRMKNK